MTSTILSKTRNRLWAAAASVVVAGAVGFGAVTSGTAPVLAEAVRIEPAQNAQTPGFADVVDRVSPAVVSVQVKARAIPASDDMSDPFSGQPGFDNLPDGHPLKKFFEEFRGEGNQDRGRRFGRRDRDENRRGNRGLSQGSGFFISEDGYIVTNNHVVDGGATFTVVTDKGVELEAKLIGTDPRTDLAVIKVEAAAEKFTYVDFADAAKVRVGDWVVAVGNPFGLGGTVTAGIVSARGRDIGAGPYDDFIQIDAAVNRGNSGGPAFNLSGEVVGVNTAIFSPSGGSVGIAFAIPASTAREVVQDLMRDGNVQRGWLGVQIQPVNPEIAESLGLAEPRGALVAEPQADSPAAKAGVEAGDVITAVDGTAIESPRELSRLIAAAEPGKDVELTIWRAGAERKLSVDLGELPGEEKQAAVAVPEAVKPTAFADLGLTVARADDGNGLVVTDVDADGEAAQRGIETGDVITSINSVEVNAVEDVQKAMDMASQAGRKSVLAQVERDDDTRFVALPVAKG